jgi:VWFA-related protein
MSARQSPPPVPAQQPPPTFRSGVTIVPVDVRVLDRDGKPVTDLTQADFTVLEDGVRQEVRHFSAHALVPMPVQAGATPAIRTRSSPAIQEQSARIFLILLGRGRLQEPSKGLDALIHMVRERLLPQDQVAVMAYNRATDFTNDHQKIVEVLERFKRGHEWIEALLRQKESGLAAIYGSKQFSEPVQREVDALFRGPKSIGSKQLMPVSVTDAAGIAADTRRGIDAAQRGEMLADRPASMFDMFAQLDAGRRIQGLGEFARLAEVTRQDLENLYTGIEYLRYLEGQKHLVYVTEQGIDFYRKELDDALAARANNARVAIDTIQTGGLWMPPIRNTFELSPRMSPPTAEVPISSPNQAAGDRFWMSALQNISESTGGQSTFWQYSTPAVDRIDVTTRFGYLLGYLPSNTSRDAKYRNISVKVNRPGVTVLYRHGYFADDMPPPVDRRSFLTSRRIAAAGNYDQNVTDIPVQVKASVTKGTRGFEILLDVTVESSRVAFTTADGQHLATLDLAIFAGDTKERVVGQSQNTMDLKLKDETYQRYMREGIPFTVNMPVAAQPKYVKVIVYDYAADLVGSTNVKLK